MQLLQPAGRPYARSCAAELIELMPEVMYLLRSSYRYGRRTGGNTTERVSVPQVRVLALVQRRPQGSLSELADLLGVSLPSASRLVSSMVRRKLIRRQTSPLDRRHMSLMLTAAGERHLALAREIGIAALAQRIARLPEEQQAAAQQTLKELRRCFVGSGARRGQGPYDSGPCSPTTNRPTTAE